MALDKWTNTGLSTLASGIDASQLTATVAAGTGSRFPVDTFNLVVFNSTDFSNPIDAADREIVRCTSRTGDVLTIIRGQEGTTGVTHNAAGKTYSVALAITQKFRDDVNNMVPPGTVMAFFQAAVPTSWTQVTTQNDKALRVVSGAGGGVGGTTAFSAAWPTHTHVVPRDGWGELIDGVTGRLVTANAGTQARVASVNNTSGDGGSASPKFIDMILASKD